jgi:hypothetical protein
MGIPRLGNSREPEDGNIGKTELDLGIEDSIMRCEMLLAMVPQAMEIYMSDGSVFLFPRKKTKAKAKQKLEFYRLLRIKLQSNPFLTGSVAVLHSSASNAFAQ